MEEIKKKLQAELAVLEHELHFKLPKVIQHAREFGDLSENAEYDAAKERQGFIEARLAELKGKLADCTSWPAGSAVPNKAVRAKMPAGARPSPSHLRGPWLADSGCRPRPQASPARPSMTGSASPTGCQAAAG